jgi:voltage-gated potassium channel
MQRLFEVLHDAFHRSTTPEYRVVNRVVWVLIVASVALFSVDAYLGKTSPAWLAKLDTVILFFFSAELLGRVVSYRPPTLSLFSMSPYKRFAEHFFGRIRFCLRPITLIDFITVAALIPQLRGLRALRLLRLIRNWKFFRYSDPIANISRVFRDNGLLYTFAFSLLGIAVITGGISIYAVESGVNPKVNSVSDGIWWALVTITTVGFGDISPVTTAGRIVGGALMVGGLFTIALFAGIIGHTLLHAVLTIREEQFRMSNYVDHIIICGYGPRSHMLLDAVRKEVNVSATDVVIFAEGDRHPDVDPEYIWIRGDPTKESELDKMRIAQARAVILVGARNMSPQQADAVTILTAFTIRSHLEKKHRENTRLSPVYVAAEILDSENVEHALTAGADEVIETNRLGFSMLSHAVAVPGAAAITSAVISSGASNIYVGKVPRRVVTPLSFGELALAVKEDGALIIGIRAPDRTDQLNPPDDLEVTADHRVIYLAEKGILRDG